MRRILVTGAATRTGGRLIQNLERSPDIEVFAVDDLDPVERFSSRFERLNIDHLRFARYLLDIKPHTVIHLQTVDRSAIHGATRAHEETTVGAQALFGAIGRCVTVKHVIVKSDGAVYGAGPRCPSVLTVDSKPTRTSGRYQRDLEQMETFVRDMADRHDHVDYTILRLAPIFGPTIRNPLSAYLTLPGVPTLLGFDPRLQLLSERDALEVFLHAVEHPVPGIFNIAGHGQLYLSRILRLGRRVPQPLPKRAFHAALRGLARSGIPLPKHTIALLKHGRVMDTGGMEETLGFEPLLTCRQAAMVGYGRVTGEISW
ncbi:MAG: NAD-dependent epimerase/dehydratase family protein [Actinomycetota bacterium]